MPQVDPEKLRVAVDAVRDLARTVKNKNGLQIGFGFDDDTIRNHVLSLIERKLGDSILTKVPRRDVEAEPGAAERPNA